MFYIVVYGYKKFSKILGEKSEWCLCCRCARVSFVRTITFFTLFCVPIFPIAVRYFKVCPKCEHTVRVGRRQFLYELRSPSALPPSPFDGGAFAAGTAREIVVRREKQFRGSGKNVKCFVDGREVACVKNGLTARFCVKPDAKNLYFAINEYSNRIHSQVIDLQVDPRSVYRLKIEKNALDLKGWNPYFRESEEAAPNI